VDDPSVARIGRERALSGSDCAESPLQPSLRSASLDGECAEQLAKGIVGKRLTYRRPKPDIPL
jgi:hypothetical protein